MAEEDKRRNKEEARAVFDKAWAARYKAWAVYVEMDGAYQKAWAHYRDMQREGN